jgi:hypothetical protein
MTSTATCRARGLRRAGDGAASRCGTCPVRLCMPGGCCACREAAVHAGRLLCMQAPRGGRRPGASPARLPPPAPGLGWPGHHRSHTHSLQQTWTGAANQSLAACPGPAQRAAAQCPSTSPPRAAQHHRCGGAPGCRSMLSSTASTSSTTAWCRAASESGGAPAAAASAPTAPAALLAEARLSGCGEPGSAKALGAARAAEGCWLSWAAPGCTGSPAAGGTCGGRAGAGSRAGGGGIARAGGQHSRHRPRTLVSAVKPRKIRALHRPPAAWLEGKSDAHTRARKLRARSILPMRRMSLGLVRQLALSSELGRVTSARSDRAASLLRRRRSPRAEQCSAARLHAWCTGRQPTLPDRSKPSCRSCPPRRHIRLQQLGSVGLRSAGCVAALPETR